MNTFLTPKKIKQIESESESSVKSQIANEWLQHIINNSDKIWDWYSISLNPNISWDIIQANTHDPSGRIIPWNWSGISSNPNISWDIIQANPDKNWDWRALSSHPNISWDIIQANPDKKWNWSGISHNPNISWDIIQANPDKNWNCLAISSNPMPTYKLTLLEQTISNSIKSAIKPLRKALFDELIATLLHFDNRNLAIKTGALDY